MVISRVKADKINDILLYYKQNNISIELKTCADYVNTGNKKYPKRLGRFTFNKHKFIELQNNNGYYLFFVYSNKSIIHGKLISSNDLSFRKSIVWNELIQINGDNNGT